MNQHNSVGQNCTPSESLENFKCRLRKVTKPCDSNNCDKSPNSICHGTDEKVTESASNEHSKEKRSSTGSINSLKRIWEGQVNFVMEKDTKSTTGELRNKKSDSSYMSSSANIPLTLGDNGENASSGATSDLVTFDSSEPTKVGSLLSKEVRDCSITHTALNTDSRLSDKTAVDKIHQSVENKTESCKNLNSGKVKRVWPPATTDCDKPAVPLKPSLRKVNPIYAIPSQRENSCKGSCLLYVIRLL